jgi:hypothetical protein
VAPGAAVLPKGVLGALQVSFRGSALIASEALLAGGISLEEKGLINEPRR